MASVIRVDNLRKTFRVARRQPGAWGAVRHLLAPGYQEVHAVEGVTFSMEAGEMVGYLGPNGAGKSTTIKMLTGLLVPSAGELWVDGCLPWRERTRYVRRIGAVFGQRTTLWWDLPVIDSFELVQVMYRIPPERYRRNLDAFRQLLDLDAFLNTPVRSLSLGQRMRADLCAALLHEPRLVFLDEPTIGLDVVARERIRQFIQYIHQQNGTTIVLTTHDLADVERLCERVMILDQGRLLYDGRLGALVERFEDCHRLVVTFAGPVVDANLPELPPPERQGDKAVYRFDPRQTSATETIQGVLSRFRITDFEVQRPELEETIRRIYEEKLLQIDCNEHSG